MTLFWIAQIIGGIAFLVGITMFFNRNERRFKFQLAGYSTIMCVHFFMLGANAAGMSVLLSAIRTVVSIWWRNVWIMVLFIILPLLFAATRVKHPIEFLPVMGAMVSAWAMFRTSGTKMRSLMWCSTACWVIHNVWVHSIGGTLIESSFLVMNGFNIIRFYRMQKRGIDPFAVESRIVKGKVQSEENEATAQLTDKPIK